MESPRLVANRRAGETATIAEQAKAAAVKKGGRVRRRTWRYFRATSIWPPTSRRRGRRSRSATAAGEAGARSKASFPTNADEPTRLTGTTAPKEQPTRVR